MSRNSTYVPSPLEGGYRFAQSNGNITAVQEMEKGRWHNEKIDRHESWSVTGNSVVKTESHGNGTEVTLYTDSNGDGVYFEALSWNRPSMGSSDHQYRFTFDLSGKASSVQERDHSRWKTEHIDSNETYTHQDGLVVKSEIEKGRTEWTVYADSNGDGTWTELAQGHGLVDLVAVKSLLTGMTADGLIY